MRRAKKKQSGRGSSEELPSSCKVADGIKIPTEDDKLFIQKKLRAALQKCPHYYGTRNKAKVYVEVDCTTTPATIRDLSGTELTVIDEDKLRSGKRVMYRCEFCGFLWFDKTWERAKSGKMRKRSGTAVDHIAPVVNPETGFTTWDDHIERLWSRGLQVLCRACHDLKSFIETERRTYGRRERKQSRCVENKES